MLQYAGGEPTLRKDLPDITRKAKELGFTEVMVSTNGVKMSKSVEYCRELKEAGLNDSALHWDLVNTEKKTVTAHLTSGERVIVYDDGMFKC